MLFIYPRTGKPGEPLPPGWDLIPGARGCTPQSCAFRDLHGEFAERGVEVCGLSAQSPEDQAEFAERVHLQFPVLSDPELKLAKALALPTFDVASMPTSASPSSSATARSSRSSIPFSRPIGTPPRSSPGWMPEVSANRGSA